MSTLILHIGTAKTGTTTIQRFLAANRDALASQRIFMPSFCRASTHVEVVLLGYAGTRNDDITRLWQLDTSTAARCSKIKEWLSKLQNEVSQKEGTWIISSEFFHSRLNRDEDLLRLSQSLYSIFESVRVLVYLRDPLEAVVSLMSTAIKAGQHVPALPKPGQQPWDRVCNHRDTVLKWESAFGTSSVVPRIFSRDAFVKGSLITDFCSTVGILDDHLSIPLTQNEALSGFGLCVLNELNRRLPDQGKQGSFFQLRSHLVSSVAEACSDELPYGPSNADICAYERYYSESNNYIKKRFFPATDILFPCQIGSALDVPRDAGEPIELSVREQALISVTTDLFERYARSTLLASRVMNRLAGFSHAFPPSMRKRIKSVLQKPLRSLLGNI